MAPMGQEAIPAAVEEAGRQQLMARMAAPLRVVVAVQEVPPRTVAMVAMVR